MQSTSLSSVPVVEGMKVEVSGAGISNINGIYVARRVHHTTDLHICGSSMQFQSVVPSIHSIAWWPATDWPSGWYIDNGVRGIYRLFSRDEHFFPGKAQWDVCHGKFRPSPITRVIENAPLLADSGVEPSLPASLCRRSDNSEVEDHELLTARVEMVVLPTPSVEWVGIILTNALLAKHVVEGSAADRNGVRAGWRVCAVAGESVSTLQDFGNAMNTCDECGLRSVMVTFSVPCGP